MRRRPAFAGLLLLCGCNQVFGLDPPASGERVDAAGDGATGTWGAPIKVPIASALGIVEDDPVISPFGDELYFSAFADGEEEIMVAASDSGGGWETAVVSELSALGVIDSSLRLTIPSNDPNGLVGYFATNRIGGGELDIYIAQRTGGEAFTNPAPVTLLNTLSEESTAAPCQAGTRFIVATKRDSVSSDLYEIIPGGLMSPITEVNTLDDETGPFITENCLHLYYASNDLGTLDLYMITRTAIDQPWGLPTRIEELSTPGNQEGDPWVSPDERHMLFASSEGGDFNILEAFR